MAVIIGKAAIKVYPDTKRFREETLAKLKKELAGLDKDVNEQQRLQVKAEVVVDKEKSAKNFKAFMDKLNDQVVKVTVDVDVSDKLADINKQVEDAINGAESKPKVTPEVDTSKFEKDIDAAAERMESELTEAFEGALDGDRVREWSDRFNKELSKVRREISRSLEGITDLGSMNSINSAGQQMLNNAKQMEQALRNEEMARRRLAKLMNAKKQDADAILAAERKVLEATEAREAAERAAGLSRDKLAKAHIDGIERSKKAAASAAESRMRAMEAEFAKVMDETNKASDAAAAEAEKMTRTLEDVGNQAYWAQAQMSELFEADREWMDEAERGAYALRDRNALFKQFAENAKHNFKEAARGAREFATSIRDAGEHTRDLEMDIDMSTLEGNLQIIRNRLQEIKDDFDGTELEFHPLLDETSYRAVWARIKWLTRDRIAMIYPVVSKGAAALAERTLKAITLNATGLRNAGRALKNFFEYLERLDKNAPVLGLIATGIAAIGGAALAAVGTISHLVVEFTRMAGAGLALPGILGGFAVGIGVMVAALQDFNEEVPKVREDLGRMQDSLSQKFWQQARVPLLDAWNKILPSLEDGFDRTAVSLGKWTAAMADGLSSNLSTESMSYMFENLAESIDIAAESGDDFGRIIEVLGKRGSEYLPRLAQWGNDVMASFRGWLDEADRTGELNRMIETGITKLKEFGVLVRESGELIYLLGSAAERAGFSGLKEMSEGLEEVNESLKRNQDSLDDYFEGAANIADGFKSLLGSIISGLGDFSGTFEHISGDVRDVFEDIGDALETVLGNEKFQQGVEDLFGGIESAIDSLSGKAPEIAEVLGSISSLAGTVLENIGDLGAEIIDAFGPEISQVLEDLEGPIDDLSDAFSGLLDVLSGADGSYDLIDALSRLISVGASALIETAADNIDTLAQSIEELKSVFEGDFDFSNFEISLESIFKFISPVTFTIGEWLGGLDIAGAVRDWVSEQIEEIGNAFETLGRWVSTAMGWLATEIGNAFSFDGLFAFDDWFPDIAQNVSEWWSKQMSDISAIFSGIGAFFEGIGKWVSETMGAFFEWLGELFSGEGEGGSGVANIGMGIVDWFDFSAVIPAIQEKWTQLKTGVQTAWDNFWSWLTGLFENPESGEFDFFGTIQRWLGLEDVTFEGLFDSAKEALQNAWDTFWSWVGGLFGGGEGGDSGGGGGGFDIDFRLNALDNASAVVAGVGTTMRVWASNIYQAALDAIDKTKTIISTAKNNLVTWAKGVYRAALTAINRTQAVINKAKTNLQAWANRVYRAALTAINKTQAVINRAKSRLTAWARAKYQAALTALNNTGTGISRAVSAIRSRVVNATFKAKVTMSNVVSGLGTVVSKIRNAVSNFVANVSTRFNNNNGNVFDSVQAFANGGITSMTGGGSDPRMRYAWENHKAQIAPAGAMRLWAEPETGGEAYIPLSPAKRARSTAILSDVADRFGYKLQQFNNGSEPPRGGDTSYGGNNYTVNVQTLRPDVASEVTGDVMFHLKHLAYGGGRQHGF